MLGLRKGLVASGSGRGLVIVAAFLALLAGAGAVKKKGSGVTKTIEPPRMSTEDNFVQDNSDFGYMREFVAILGGVLGFWGGVGSMGTVFLFILMTQRYCCRPNKDKDDSG